MSCSSRASDAVDEARGVSRSAGLCALRFALAFALTLGVGSVRAQDALDAFESARSEFEQHAFESAVAKFSQLLSEADGPLDNEVIELEARKYLGVSYFLLGNTEQAKLQFELLLRLKADYTLDPVRFPSSVYETFSQVKRDLAARQAQPETTEAPARQRFCLTESERASLVQWLSREAGYQEIERRSRWFAAIPFGVGQFYNGHRAAGWTFGILSALAGATAITTGVLHQSLGNTDVRDDEIGDARSAERSLRVVNWASLGALAGLAIASVVDAQLRFVPERRRFRREAPPAQLRELRTLLQGDRATKPKKTAPKPP